MEDKFLSIHFNCALLKHTQTDILLTVLAFLSREDLLRTVSLVCRQMVWLVERYFTRRPPYLLLHSFEYDCDRGPNRFLVRVTAGTPLLEYTVAEFAAALARMDPGSKQRQGFVRIQFAKLHNLKFLFLFLPQLSNVKIVIGT
jgi:hypothetical protein